MRKNCSKNICIHYLCVYTHNVLWVVAQVYLNAVWKLRQIILLSSIIACINLTRAAAAAMLKRLRGGCSVYSKLALYHPPSPSPIPFAHRHTLWVCEFKCVLCACLSGLSLYVHAHREVFFLVYISGFLCLFQFLYTVWCDLLLANSRYKILESHWE